MHWYHDTHPGLSGNRKKKNRFHVLWIDSLVEQLLGVGVGCLCPINLLRWRAQGS